MRNLSDLISQLEQEFFSKLSTVSTHDALEAFRVEFLGRNGRIAQLMPQLKDLSLEEKQRIGPLINTLKQKTQDAYFQKKQTLEQTQLQQELDQYKYFDVTAYVPDIPSGSLHPITHIQQQIENIFISMGYRIVDGPEIETEFYNFEALNIPSNHPARDMQDTLWLNLPGMLLRTHTSTVQIHTMEHEKPPFALTSVGRVYRHEATDATHDFMFNQVEGLIVSTDICLAHLLTTLERFFKALFNKQDLTIRARPSYFPFVEPGVEIDISCPFCTTGCSICKKTRWIEMGGSGLVHPNVLKACNIDPTKYSGFAFGLGVDRITMLSYGINDIRLFTSNKVEFLKQF